jgi:hypothetical protein
MLDLESHDFLRGLIDGVIDEAAMATRRERAMSSQRNLNGQRTLATKAWLPRQPRVEIFRGASRISTPASDTVNAPTIPRG